MVDVNIYWKEMFIYYFKGMEFDSFTALNAAKWMTTLIGGIGDASCKYSANTFSVSFWFVMSVLWKYIFFPVKVSIRSIVSSQSSTFEIKNDFTWTRVAQVVDNNNIVVLFEEL